MIMLPNLTSIRQNFSWLIIVLERPLATDTAGEVGITNGQIVLAIRKDPEYNMNAALRNFYLCDVSGSSKKLTVQAELTMKVLKLYYMAAEIYRCHVSQLVLMHKNRVLAPNHTIRSAGIRSLKRVYCLPLKK
ncbi:uncharacterized protein LOC110682725 [Chenopodium quinoa]|uniref:uncharacterized protein LOC110682725 n=1 Tax=Chenopodium quinoa TaxID=63459 RepID=UPI000B780C87|nr:uncharacterized protein LOC110682725 [Chenopodium quinoa]